MDTRRALYAHSRRRWAELDEWQRTELRREYRHLRVTGSSACIAKGVIRRIVMVLS